MKGDLLSEATRALRENVDGSSENPSATEDRILSLLPRKRRVRLVRPWGFSLAALLIGSSVWAMGGGAPLRSWLAGLTVQDAPQKVAEAKKVEAQRPRRLASTTTSPPVASPVASSEPKPEEPESPLVDPPRAAPPATHDIAPPPSLGAAEDASASEPATTTPEREVVEPVATGGVATADVALDVYERAHDLHFKRRDYAGALVAWEQYLAIAPSGSLALEARFHRGVCLVRLGRSEDARRTLEPFARGDYGTYRREQAQKLLRDIP